ncbi:MAG: GGDEF domain-containing protein [Betaproteobacteria bacterium]|nr:GGDEF domain-containing protein [Betaproteobacteria bacterium]
MEATAPRLSPPPSGGFLDKLVPLSHWLDAGVAKRDEQHNAYARLAWTVIVCIWALVASGLQPKYLGVYGCIAFALLFSLAYLWTVFRWPAPSRPRRAAALLYDNLAISYVASFGGPFAPFVWFHFWTTVAFGLRFGPAYVPRAASVAIAGLLWNLMFSAYWQAHRAFGFSVVLGLLGIAATSWVAFRDIAAAHAHTANRARQDALTGVPNRQCFTEHFSQALARTQRTGRALALLLLDLDGFKAVNDALGHAAGDALLQEIASRLGRRLRRSDMLARMGGDEFAILLEPVGERVDAASVAEELVRAVAGLEAIGEASMSVGASIGIVLVDAASARSAGADELVKRADRAMYEAKRAGKGRYAFAD